MGALDFTALPQQLINGLNNGAIYALIALGYTMVYGVLRLINFAHGEVFMVGSFVALFVSWQMGFYQGNPNLQWATGPMVLILMLAASMTVCAVLGVVIERFAYRPLRNQPRTTSLITAIGISLFLQYAGALVLPVAPPKSIISEVNPFKGNVEIPLKPKDAGLLAELKLARTAAEEAEAKVTAEVKRLGVNSKFDLTTPEGQAIRKAQFDADDKARKLEDGYADSGVSVKIPEGQLIMVLTTLFMMLILRHLILFTPMGRQMRAVSHDFDSASLMGINVNKVVTVTFVIGSALAGAGAMMCATFLGTPLQTYVGVTWGVKAFVAAVLGGIGNIPGAVLGGLLIGIAEVLAVWAGASAWRDAIAFVILIAVLLFKPSGLLGSAKVEKV